MSQGEKCSGEDKCIVTLSPEWFVLVRVAEPPQRQVGICNFKEPASLLARKNEAFPVPVNLNVSPPGFEHAPAEVKSPE
jgi:hypothetical protein